jgi:hypothetical protein
MIMKKLVIYLIAITFISCVSNDQYEEYNIDPNNPSEVEADFLFNSALKTLVDIKSDPNINLNINRLIAQYWTTTTYPDESNYVMNIRDISGNFWGGVSLNVLLDLKSAKELVTADNLLTETQKSTRLAQADVIMIYAWQLLVDTFGNVPYNQALDLDNYSLPAYDDAAFIYEDLIDRIDLAISNLNDQGFEIDNLYYGDVNAWRTFASSLKLRLGIRLTDINPTLAKTTVESAYNSGIFSSNGDNAVLNYPGGANPNPIWTDIVQSGRQDFVGANTLIDIMNELDDPRRSIYFQENLGVGVFDGGIYGDVNTYSFYSHIGTEILEPNLPGALLDYAEISFYLAEAAERGYNVGGTAEDYYHQGISASFDYWNVPDVTSYLDNPDVSYSTAIGDWREKIGNQFWLAMYNRGFEGWTVWRKYDAPQFNLPAISNNPVPTRYQYPINEQNLNEANWIQAASAIGGDAQTTKLFWDLN